MGISLCIIWCFFLIVFSIFFLSLSLVNLINIDLVMFLLGFILYGDSLHFLDFSEYFLSHVREAFDYYIFKYFSGLFSLYSSSGIPIMWMLVCLMLSQRSLELPRWLSGNEPTWQCRRCRRWGFDPWVRKISWRRNGNLLQYSCLDNPMDRGAWQTTVHEVTKSWTWLSNWAHVHACTHIYTHTHTDQSLRLSLFLFIVFCCCCYSVPQ